jgi:hypothetical protein
VTVAGRLGNARLMDDGRSGLAELLLCVGGCDPVHAARTDDEILGFLAA